MADANVALREDLILNRVLLHLVGDDDGVKEDPLAPRDLLVSLLGDSLRDILNFSVVNARFRRGFLKFAAVNKYRNKHLSKWYGNYTTKFSPISILPDEILERILDFLTLNSGHLMPIAHRASLSVDSFSSIAPSSPEDSTRIQQFVR
jgi:hypothetical protein